MSDGRYTPIEVGVALSLYAYNVSPHDRAQKLYDHFGGQCAEIVDLVEALMPGYAHTACTDLAMPTALVYVDHALKSYGDEARTRVMGNLGPNYASHEGS